MAGKPQINRASASKYTQGKFRPRNPQKYKGDPTQIQYRSRWELQFMRWCDCTGAVVAWGSEEIIIPYRSPIDGNVHRYFTDFYLEVRQSQSGEAKKFLVEIKPYAQTVPPKKGSKNIAEASMEYQKNQAKWEAAKRFCEARNWRFMTLTEKDLFRKPSNAANKANSR